MKTQPVIYNSFRSCPHLGRTKRPALPSRLLSTSGTRSCREVPDRRATSPHRSGEAALLTSFTHNPSLNASQPSTLQPQHNTTPTQHISFTQLHLGASTESTNLSAGTNHKITVFFAEYFSRSLIEHNKKENCLIIIIIIMYMPQYSKHAGTILYHDPLES